MERKVTVIPPTLNMQTHQPETQRVKRRVAGYARISTDVLPHTYTKIRSNTSLSQP